MEKISTQIFLGRFRGVGLFFSLFIILSFIIRTTLLLYSFDALSVSIFAILKIYAVGLFFDIQAASFFALPFVAYLILIPDKIFNHPIHRYINYFFYFCVITSLVFSDFSEWFFWEEFGVRFNFIAVDYLIYTHEVIGNIRESYPLPSLLSAVGILSGIIFWIILKTGGVENSVCVS